MRTAYGSIQCDSASFLLSFPLPKMRIITPREKSTMNSEKTRVKAFAAPYRIKHQSIKEFPPPHFRFIQHFVPDLVLEKITSSVRKVLHSKLSNYSSAARRREEIWSVDEYIAIRAHISLLLIFFAPSEKRRRYFRNVILLRNLEEAPGSTNEM
jgi:hypothetical protein